MTDERESLFEEDRLKELKRQKLVLMEEIVRRRSLDPLRNFKPHEKQKLFIDSILKGRNKESWFIAANRAGKSDAGAYIGATLARFGLTDEMMRNKPRSGAAVGASHIEVRDRATSGWVSALDFPTARDVIQPKYFDNGFVNPQVTHEPFIPKHEIEHWDPNAQVLRIKNGSLIGYKSAESGAKKYQGAEKNWIHFDEEHTYQIYKEAGIRISGATDLIIFCTCTLLPEEGKVGGVSWAFSQIIEPWKKGKKSIGVFNASIYDNPHLPPEKIAELEDRYPEGSVERRIRLGGELIPGLSGSRCYVSFLHSLHVRRQPDLNKRRPVLWTLDFNVDPFCSLIMQREGTLFRVYKELVVEGGGIPAMCEAFYNYVQGHLAEVWIYGDATSKGRSRQTGKTDYTAILNEMMPYGFSIRLKVPEGNPPVPDRVNAVNAAFRNHVGETFIEVDPSCHELIADLEQVLRDPHGGIKKIYDPRNSYSRRTHSSDALGYLIAYERPVRREKLGTRGDPPKTVKSPQYGRLVSSPPPQRGGSN